MAAQDPRCATGIAMPTLVRLFVFLLIVAGLGFAGMIALTIMVDPGEKDITIKIPARELAQAQTNKPLDLNDLPAPVNVAPKDATSAGASAAASSAEPSIDTADPNANQPGVKTVNVGAE
jgi:hypothetical protein